MDGIAGLPGHTAAYFEVYMQSVTTDPNVLTRILDHLKLPSAPLTLAPARSSFDEQDLFSDEEAEEPVIRQDPGPGDGQATARAPP